LNKLWARAASVITGVCKNLNDIRHLKLTEAMYASSRELHVWCDENKNRVYIPEWLLNLDIREVASTMLQAAGYKVLPVENTTAAVEVVRTTSERIDLLLTDIMMSGMSGVELYDRVRALRLGIKGLYMTGYAGDELSRRGLLKSDVPVVQKPFDSHTLLGSVRAVLDRDNS